MIKLNEMLYSKEKLTFLKELINEHSFGCEFVLDIISEDQQEIVKPEMIFYPALIDQKVVESVRNASSKVYKAMIEYCNHLINKKTEYLCKIGYSDEIVALILAQDPILPPDVRFDLAVNPNVLNSDYSDSNFKILEVNVPQQGFYWISHIVNSLACAYFGVKDPNENCYELSTNKLLEYFLHVSESKGVNLQLNPIVFSTPKPFKNNKLDLICRLLPLYKSGLNVIFSDLENLSYQNVNSATPGMYLFNDQLVGLLDLMLLPERYLNFFWEKPVDGKLRPWESFTELIKSKHLVEVNSSFGFLMESKAFLADMYQNRHVLSKENQNTIESHIPYSSFSAFEVFQKSNLIWEKSFHGNRGEEVKKLKRTDYFKVSTTGCMYQANSPMFKLNHGETDLTILFTCFVNHDSTPTGIGLRAIPFGEHIIGTRELWLPFGLK